MSFAEAHTLPFTNEHQPYSAATTLRAATNYIKGRIFVHRSKYHQAQEQAQFQN